MAMVCKIIPSFRQKERGRPRTRHRTIAVGNMPDVIVKIPCGGRGGGDAAKRPTATATVVRARTAAARADINAAAK